MPSALIREIRTWRLAVTGEGDPPVRQVEVVQSEFADGPGAGGMHGRQGDGQPPGGRDDRLLDGPDLLGGHRQHRAAGANLRQVKSSSRQPANSCSISSSTGGMRSCGSTEAPGRFISSSG
ncbi:MAG: hypothetical protein ACRDPF_21325, partial [Streptosporangiaceae bacterium]